MSVKQKVLSTFKSLHRVASYFNVRSDLTPYVCNPQDSNDKLFLLDSSKTFGGDERSLSIVQNKINEEFKKNKHVQNEGSIDELIKLAKDVEYELKTNVIQAKEKEPGVYEANITVDTTKLDNVIFNEEAVLAAKPRSGGKRCK